MAKTTNLYRSAMANVRKKFVRVFVFSMFLNLTVLVVPLYMLQVYDRVLTSQSSDTLMFLTLLAGALLLAMALVEMARSWLLVQSASWLDGALNSALFKVSLNNRLEGSDSSIGQPLRDLEVVRSFLTGPGLPALFDTPWVPLYLGLVFLMHPVFGIIALTGTIVILILAIASDYLTRTAARESSNAQMMSNSFLDGLARNADAIHAMGMVGGLNKLWLQSHEAGVAWQDVAGDRAAVVNSFAKAFRMSLQVAILGSGAYLAIQQIVSPGLMIAASIIMSRALAPAEAAIANWRNFIAARQANERLRGLFEHTNIDDGDRTELPAPKGYLAVDGLFMRHKGAENWLLQNISFQIDAGETLGIVGPSGIGKSTLVRMLIGLAKPNMGSVRLDGAEIAEWSRDKLGPHIGYVPQEVELLVGTVADNISRFGTPDAEKIVAAAQLAGAHELILRLGNSYETIIGDGGSKISGGQRQRIALARALYGDPSYIVLDEPNSNLDLEGQHALQQTLHRLKELGKSVVIVSHRASVMSAVDKLLLIKDSKEYMFGPRDDVLAQLKPKSQPAATQQPAPQTNQNNSASA